MSSPYTLVQDLAAAIEIPRDGILSRTVFNNDRLKIVFFGFSQAQELSAHTSPMPAILYFVQGEATLTLGEDKHEARAGTLVHMPPLLPHSIQARTPLSLMLVLLKR